MNQDPKNPNTPTFIFSLEKFFEEKMSGDKNRIYYFMYLIITLCILVSMILISIRVSNIEKNIELYHCQQNKNGECGVIKNSSAFEEYYQPKTFEYHPEDINLNPIIYEYPILNMNIFNYDEYNKICISVLEFN